MVEGARLLSEYTVTPYRGFESPPLRHLPNHDFQHNGRESSPGQQLQTAHGRRSGTIEKRSKTRRLTNLLKRPPNRARSF